MAIDGKRLQTRLSDAGYYTAAIDGDIGRKTYAALFSAIARRDLGDRGLTMGAACVPAFKEAALTSSKRIAHFLAQTATETGGYKALSEDLSYSAAGLMATWPTRFPDEAATAGFVNNPIALANRVYGNRLGNGPPASGDGWKYRGRGLIQLTGKANYAKRAEETGIALVTSPELAAEPGIAVKIACLYWTARAINPLADADDLAKVRKAVNGGSIGLADAKIYLKRAKALLD